MDVDTAWQKFREANIKKAENQTSVDDKLDVILAQQQEILTDTSRVADLVPLVTGDKAEEDALEETGDLEAQDELNPEGAPEEQALDENGQPIEEASEEGVPAEDEEAEAEGENPFAFLDEEEGEATEEQSEEGEPESDDYEETDEETDIMADEDVAEDESEEEGSDVPYDEEEVSEEETEDSEDESEETEESEGEDEDYISFDSLSDDDEEESDEEETKKSVKETPRTKTIKSFGTPTPMTVIKTVQKPTADYSYGRASSAEQISDMLMKGTGQSDDDFQIGYGVDPHKAVEKDWAEFRLMKKLNANLF